jgi:hypothetical protein
MCEWKYDDGSECGCKDIGTSRGLKLCRVHYQLIRADNKYRAKHNIGIPHLDQTIKRRISKVILNSKVNNE